MPKLNGPRLRAEIARRGMSEILFAERAGVSPNTVSAAIHGKAIMPASLRKIASTLARLPALHGAEDLVAV